MLLGGLWHGAGWTFVIWGGLHGLFLMINHGWRAVKARTGFGDKPSSMSYRIVCRILTFVAVTVAWVFFRAENLDSAILILSTMFSVSEIGMPGAFVFDNNATKAAGILILLLGIVWVLPNVSEWAGYGFGEKTKKPVERKFMERHLFFKATKPWAVVTSLLFVIAVLNLTKVSEFIYFNF